MPHEYPPARTVVDLQREAADYQQAMVKQQAAYESQKHIETLVRQMEHEKAVKMANLYNNSVRAGQYLGAQGGGLNNQANQQLNAQAGLGQVGQGAQWHNARAVPLQGSKPTAEVMLQEVAKSLGMDDTAVDGYTLLAMVLAEIVKKAGIGVPIPEKKDFYDALSEAKESEACLKMKTL